MKKIVFSVMLAVLAAASCAMTGQNAVHHGTDTDGGKLFQLHAILSVYVLAQVTVAILQSTPDVVDAVSPQAVNQLVLPTVAALCYGFIVGCYQHSFYSCRTQFDSKYTFAC